MTVHFVINERMCLRFAGVGLRVIESTLVFTCQLRSALRVMATRRRDAGVLARTALTRVVSQAYTNLDTQEHEGR